MMAFTPSIWHEAIPSFTKWCLKWLAFVLSLVPTWHDKKFATIHWSLQIFAFQHLKVWKLLICSLSMFQQCEETEIYRIKSNKTIPRALRLKRHLIMALSFLGKEHRRKSKPKIQPRDSLTLIPNFMGLFKTSKKSTVSHVFSFSSAISSDIIAVSRPRIVLLNQLGKHVQKANPEPAEG